MRPITIIYSILLLNIIYAISSYKLNSNEIFRSSYSLSRKFQKITLNGHPGNFRLCNFRPQNLALPEK